MKREINIANWKRKDHFNFFNSFDEPLFGITVRVECAAAYQKAKENNYPFSLYYLYLSLQVAHEIEEFRYRIEDNKIYCYDTVGAGPTVFRDDETFGFAYYQYYTDIDKFMTQARLENEKVKAQRGLQFSHTGEDIIHYSTLPWADFTAVNHARKWDAARSVPKITFGKLTRDGDKMWLPLDIHVSHALMDGYHVGKFIERFEQLLADAN